MSTLCCHDRSLGRNGSIDAGEFMAGMKALGFEPKADEVCMPYVT